MLWLFIGRKHRHDSSLNVAIIGNIAPTVATAIGSPVAGEIISAVAGIVGAKEPSTAAISDVINQGKLTSEQITELKKYELQLQDLERERGFRYEELSTKDVADARARDVSSKDNVNRNLAYLIIVAFVATTACTLAGVSKVDSVLAGTLIGYLSAKAEQILNYYFGSTRSSEQKNALLANSVPISSSETGKGE